MIIKKPLTPAQLEAIQKPSDDAVRNAQDALFMYLLNRVAELEAKLDPPKKLRKSVT